MGIHEIFLPFNKKLIFLSRFTQSSGSARYFEVFAGESPGVDRGQDMSRRTKAIIAASMLSIGATFALLSRSNTTMGQRVNALLDDLQAAGVRFLDLPMFMLVVVSIALSGIAVIAVEKLALGKLLWRRTVLATLGLSLLIGLAIVADEQMNVGFEP